MCGRTMKAQHHGLPTKGGSKAECPRPRCRKERRDCPRGTCRSTCAGSPRPQGCTLHVATCVGVRPTLPPCSPPAIPTMSPTMAGPTPPCSVGSPAHPATPAALAQWLARLPWTWVSRTKGPQLPSSQVAPGQLLGVRRALECSPVELIEEVWANARGICGSGGALCSLKPPQSARNVCRVCKVPAASPGPASSLPRKRGRGSSFHNKSPAWGSCSCLNRGPRC